MRDTEVTEGTEKFNHRDAETQSFQKLEPAESNLCGRAGSAASLRDARDRTRTDPTSRRDRMWFVDPSDPGAPAGLQSRPAAEPASSVSLFLCG